VKEILRAPAALLSAVGPNDAGKAATSEADQRTQRLADGALVGALLGEHAAPVGGDSEELR